MRGRWTLCAPDVRDITSLILVFPLRMHNLNLIKKQINRRTQNDEQCIKNGGDGLYLQRCQCHKRQRKAVECSKLKKAKET